MPPNKDPEQQIMIHLFYYTTRLCWLDIIVVARETLARHAEKAFGANLCIRERWRNNFEVRAQLVASFLRKMVSLWQGPFVGEYTYIHAITMFGERCLWLEASSHMYNGGRKYLWGYFRSQAEHGYDSHSIAADLNRKGFNRA